MDKTILRELFTNKLYKIPDYQRGYAWEEQQLKDFIQDIDALVDEKVGNHYTGTIVIYQSKNKPVQNYGTDNLELVDVVDGQQRLTTCCLYLSIIINKLIKNGLCDYNDRRSRYLFSGSTSKLTLNNDTKDIFYDLLSKGTHNSFPQNPHQKRLQAAYLYLNNHIDSQLVKRKYSYIDYLKNLLDAIERKLNFTFYTIEEECEIGMTFELMNSRGKGLSVLELLKNYLMYWVSRNISKEVEGSRKDLTDTINKNWKEIYTNLGRCDGKEDQCLRVAWTLFCTYTPKYWKGYEGFKNKTYIPLREFTEKTSEETNLFIRELSDGLAEISKHYAVITNPELSTTMSGIEFKWLSKIHNTGNIANFLPLLISTRIHCDKDVINDEDYYELLKALECYAYRVFLFEGKRSNAGMSSLFKWGYEVFKESQNIKNIPSKIYALANLYSPENLFKDWLSKPAEWYSFRRLLRYTLFEYELHLLDEKGKGMKPKLEWNNLSDSTIEHILPQTPDDESEWKKKWSAQDIKVFLHDIGNLVLTENNSNYRNFEFERKKGQEGTGFCYAHSDIRQERDISAFKDWTALQLVERRKGIVEWIENRWSIVSSATVLSEDINEDDNSEE